MKYNFVIFASKFYVYETAYSDIFGFINVKYINDPIARKNKFIKLLYRIHHSPWINKYINLPLKSIWFKSYFTYDFEENKPICFIFFRDTLYLEKLGYIDYLKNKYNESKFVVFFQDLISLYPNIIDIKHCKNVFDLILSFDHKEAEKHNLIYSPLVNSKSKNDLSSDYDESDIFFLGFAKNRLDLIHRTYEILKNKNLKCIFFLVGVKKEDQKYSNEIKYIKSMDYIDNLRYIAKTKCLLEIMQIGGHGYTQRMVEAITYYKKIITNNIQIKNAPFYSHLNILNFSDPQEIIDNTEFFKDFSRKANHNYEDEISPKKLLELILNNI